MDFCKTTAALGATACLLMASSAFATALKSETFEGTNDTGAWTGDVAQEEGFGEVPHFLLEDGNIKIPAAWLLE